MPFFIEDEDDDDDGVFEEAAPKPPLPPVGTKFIRNVAGSKLLFTVSEHVDGALVALSARVLMLSPQRIAW